MIWSSASRPKCLQIAETSESEIQDGGGGALLYLPKIPFELGHLFYSFLLWDENPNST